MFVAPDNTLSEGLITRATVLECRCASKVRKPKENHRGFKVGVWVSHKAFPVSTLSQTAVAAQNKALLEIEICESSKV